MANRTLWWPASGGRATSPPGTPRWSRLTVASAIPFPNYRLLRGVWTGGEDAGLAAFLPRGAATFAGVAFDADLVGVTLGEAVRFGAAFAGLDEPLAASLIGGSFATG